VLLGYDLLYLLRGAPVALYGDEVGMIGSGGDKAAREDMFPTRVTDWQTEPRVGSPPIGTDSSLDVADNPIEAQLRTLSALRDANPALSTGASVVRYAQNALLVVSRIDFATGREVVTAFNNGDSGARITIKTATPGATWSVLFGTGSVAAGAGSSLAVTVPPVSAVLVQPSVAIPRAGPAVPTLKTGPDALTSYFRLSATVAGPPVSVTFAIRRTRGTWQRVAIDDSSPYQAFLDPGRFKKHEKVEGVAVARGLNGAVSVSRVATFTPNG
jgi:hypothetical protein